MTVVWFAQDKVGMHEILTGVDQHAENQQTFGLPERRIAKIFVFRLIYGGTEFSYAQDPDFMGVSASKTFWRGVIDKFYGKYDGIRRQHEAWENEAKLTGRLVMPTGRVFKFRPQPSQWGGLRWPRTQILNYPVQGTGADIVSVFRVSLFTRLSKLDPRIKFVSTVHDSVVLDIPEECLEVVAGVVRSCFDDLPNNFSRLFDCDFNLPLTGEISFGPNLKDLTELK